MVSRAAELPEDFSESPLDQQVSTLRSIVHNVCDIALGRKTPGSPSRRARWWTADLCVARREVRRLRRRLQEARRRDAELLVVELRRASADYKKIIWRVKMDDWKRFVGDHSDDPWGRVYKICRGRRKCTEIGCLRVNGELITNWGDCARVLLRNFFPVAESDAPIAIAEEVPPALETFEVDTSVARLKSRRSPGLDGINGTICKSVWRAIPQHLASLLSRCIQSGYFPSEWKYPLVVALLKGPEKDKCEPSSYRGICLLSVSGKVLEAIMVNRSTTGGPTIGVSAMDSDSSVSAMSATSAKSERGWRRGRPASKNSAPTQAKLIALSDMGAPAAVGTFEELSSLECQPSTSAAAAAAAADAPAAAAADAPAAAAAAALAAAYGVATAAARAGQAAMLAELSATQRMVRNGSAA
ncbi:hypothetical protein KR059_010740 [Drosophila kikkawai]|nr:hypothetical protein KR059_010740 [Drosophila kikkawai]